VIRGCQYETILVKHAYIDNCAAAAKALLEQSCQDGVTGERCFPVGLAGRLSPHRFDDAGTDLIRQRACAFADIVEGMLQHSVYVQDAERQDNDGDQTQDGNPEPSHHRQAVSTAHGNAAPASWDAV
jgi:hypothetical protein